MESDSVENQTVEKVKNSKIVITNKNQTSIAGVTKVISATEQCINMTICGEPASLEGSGLHVLKLDTTAGLIDIEGEVKSLKLNSNKSGKNFFKRIFS